MGERILAEWEPEVGRADNLTRWLAHYLAENLEAAKTESDPIKRRRLRRECADLILAIWKHREHWPRGQPFKALGTLAKELSEAANPFRAQEDPHSWGDLIKQLEALHQREKRWLLAAAAANEVDRNATEWEKVATGYFSNDESRMVQLRKQLFGETTVTSIKAKDSPAKKQQRLQKALRELQVHRAKLHRLISASWFEADSPTSAKTTERSRRRQPRRG